MYMKALIIGCVYYYTFSGVSVIFQIGTWNAYSVLGTTLCICYLFFDQVLQHFETVWCLCLFYK